MLSFRKGQGRGVSLRRFSFLMLFFSLIVTAALLYTTFNTVKAFRGLSEATGDYIELAAAADALMDASDYLTEEVQRYTVISDRTHLENYFREAETDRRRERALAIMFRNAPDSPALGQLQAAMKESMELMSREYYAMRLMLDAAGDTDIPAALQDVQLTEEDLALDAEAKVDKARMMMHDTEYYAQKSRIRENMQECADTLTGSTQKVRDEMQAWTDRSLKWMIILLVVQSICIFKILWLFSHLGGCAAAEGCRPHPEG